MNVVVTGASGFAGAAVAAHLAKQGFSVTNVDIAALPGALIPYRRVDLQDLGQVYGVLQGAEAVVHFAAIPRPTHDPPEVVFQTNVMGTFNIFEAAANLGIRRIVQASSVSVLGFPFYHHPIALEYVPIDEAHPRSAQDAYGVSKLVGEELGDATARRADMSIISLRLPWIHTPETFRDQVRPLQADPSLGASNLWSYVDLRDVATACEGALNAQLDGHHVLFFAAPDSFVTQPTADLVERFFPGTRLITPLQERQSLISSARAARLLGIRATHSWQSYRHGTQVDIA